MKNIDVQDTDNDHVSEAGLFFTYLENWRRSGGGLSQHEVDAQFGEKLVVLFNRNSVVFSEVLVSVSHC